MKYDTLVEITGSYNGKTYILFSVDTRLRIRFPQQVQNRQRQKRDTVYLNCDCKLLNGNSAQRPFSLNKSTRFRHVTICGLWLPRTDSSFFLPAP